MKILSTNLEKNSNDVYYLFCDVETDSGHIYGAVNELLKGELKDYPITYKEIYYEYLNTCEFLYKNGFIYCQSLITNDVQFRLLEMQDKTKGTLFAAILSGQDTFTEWGLNVKEQFLKTYQKQIKFTNTFVGGTLPIISAKTVYGDLEQFTPYHQMTVSPSSGGYYPIDIFSQATIRSWVVRKLNKFIETLGD